MKKEIVLPYDLYQRIKASAGEHGGIGRGRLFSGVVRGAPHCAHGHAWGTDARFAAWAACARRLLHTVSNAYGEEPELSRYITVTDNDTALARIAVDERVSFARWCELLNVKCGPKPMTLEEVGRIEDSRPADYGEQIGFPANFAAALIGGEK